MAKQLGEQTREQPFGANQASAPSMRALSCTSAVREAAVLVEDAPAVVNLVAGLVAVLPAQYYAAVVAHGVPAHPAPRTTMQPRPQSFAGAHEPT